MDAGFGQALVARLSRFLIRTNATVELAETAVVRGSADEADRIRAGVPAMGAELDERTIPAEVGQWFIDASVSFTKGCYTGQEVVARLYFRGRLKQRLYHLHGETPADSSAIFAAGHHVGDVVMQARDGNGLELLAVVKNDAARNGGLTLGDNGPALSLQALPYALPADKEE